MDLHHVIIDSSLSWYLRYGTKDAVLILYAIHHVHMFLGLY